MSQIISCMVSLGFLRMKKYIIRHRAQDLIMAALVLSYNVCTKTHTDTRTHQVDPLVVLKSQKRCWPVQERFFFKYC